MEVRRRRHSRSPRYHSPRPSNLRPAIAHNGPDGQQTVHGHQKTISSVQYEVEKRREASCGRSESV